MGAVVLKMTDYRDRPNKSPCKPKRNKNDPLQSPLVATTRKMAAAAIAKATEKHLSTHSTEEALVAGAYVQGMADCLVMLEFVAVELAKKATL